MLQSSMCSQLARLKLWSEIGARRTIMNPSHHGPIAFAIKSARSQLKHVEDSDKHWFCDGKRNVGVAVQLLNEHKIIAVPTDTIYGLAGLVTQQSIDSIYRIKKRDKTKPLAICISHVYDVKKWGVTNHLPSDLLNVILPGPCTVILKRTAALNPALNPGVDNVGIRVPNNKFIRLVAHLAGPLALTSANESNQQSSLKPEEFSELWPELGGLFHDCSHSKVDESRRIGSTIIDLTVPDHYSIVRKGIKADNYVNVLKSFGLKEYECN